MEAPVGRSIESNAPVVSAVVRAAKLAGAELLKRALEMAHDAGTLGIAELLTGVGGADGDRDRGGRVSASWKLTHLPVKN